MFPAAELDPGSASSSVAAADVAAAVAANTGAVAATAAVAETAQVASTMGNRDHLPWSRWAIELIFHGEDGRRLWGL